jgi:hypothetical protein
MAAPVVAGAAALVRQYVEEGWHHCGGAQPRLGFSPSAALVKAMLISSARRPTSNFTLHAPNDDHGDCQVCVCVAIE